MSIIIVEYNKSEAIYLYDADEVRRRLESDSIQLVGLHKKGIRY